MHCANMNIADVVFTFTQTASAEPECAVTTTFDCLRAVLLKINVFWVVTPCRLQTFRRIVVFQLLDPDDKELRLF